MNCLYCNVILTNVNWSVGKQKKGYFSCDDCHTDKYKKYRNKFPFRVKASNLNVKNNSSITEEDLIDIWSKQEGKCVLCGEILEKRNCIDHIISKNSGGLTIRENLQFLCEKCNIGKHHWSTEEYLKHCEKVFKNTRS